MKTIILIQILSLIAMSILLIVDVVNLVYLFIPIPIIIFWRTIFTITLGASIVILRKNYSNKTPDENK